MHLLGRNRTYQIKLPFPPPPRPPRYAMQSEMAGTIIIIRRLDLLGYNVMIAGVDGLLYMRDGAAACIVY